MYTYTFVQKGCVIKCYDLRSLNFKNCISGISFEINPYDTFQRFNHVQWIIYKFTHRFCSSFPLECVLIAFLSFFQSITITFLYCILLGEIPPGNLLSLPMPQGIDWEL